MAVKPAENISFEYTVPVVIVGAGACGLTAALAARDGGAEVLVLERDANPAGSTSLSAGLIPAANTRYQREKNIEDDAQIFFDDLRAKAKDQSDPEIVMAVAKASGETIDWLSEKHGLDFHLVEGFYYPGHSRLRMHGPKSQTGADLEQALLVAVENAGIDVLTEASVEDVYAYADGRVAGVAFTRPDGAIETVGCDTLILACNGFGGNPEMIKQFIPEMTKADYCGHTSNTGDAIRWGEALGADLGDMASYQGHGSVAYPHGLPLTWAVITRGGFQVNLNGERFANEMRGYSEHAEEVIRQPQHLAWDIYDLHCEEPALGFHDYREITRLGAVKRADTIEELAALIEVPVGTLKATLEETQACARGEQKDALGRDFTTGAALQAPFLACKVNGALFHTQGGLIIDTQAQVLTKEGAKLPNLFAGGGAARGLSGPSSWGYMSGNGLLAATVLGRIAGQSAAKLAQSK